jgi:hypothetical protein
MFRRMRPTTASTRLILNAALGPGSITPVWSASVYLGRARRTALRRNGMGCSGSGHLIRREPHFTSLTRKRRRSLLTTRRRTQSTRAERCAIHWSRTPLLPVGGPLAASSLYIGETAVVFQANLRHWPSRNWPGFTALAFDGS